MLRPAILGRETAAGRGAPEWLRGPKAGPARGARYVPESVKCALRRSYSSGSVYPMRSGRAFPSMTWK